MGDALKPCPFCGGDAEEAMRTGSIFCTECDVSQRTKREWNRRAALSTAARVLGAADPACVVCLGDGLQADGETPCPCIENRQGDEVALPVSEWHEDLGYVVWWKFPVEEPSWIGSPLCEDWPGYHTHFTPHPRIPAAPVSLKEE